MRRRGALQGKRAGSRLHAVGGVDVGFEQHRDAVQGAEHVAGPAHVVHVLRDGQRIWIELDDGIDPISTRVERMDALDVGARQPHRGQRAASHPGLQLRHGGFEKGKVVGLGSRRERRDEQRGDENPSCHAGCHVVCPPRNVAAQEARSSELSLAPGDVSFRCRGLLFSSQRADATRGANRPQSTLPDHNQPGVPGTPPRWRSRRRQRRYGVIPARRNPPASGAEIRRHAAIVLAGK